MRILFLGGGFFYDLQVGAMARNGHRVTQIDPNYPWSRNWLTWRWVYETGGIGLENLVEARVLRCVKNESFDLIWVGGGHLVGPALLRRLRNHAPILLNYNPDNPYVARDRRLWETFKRAVPEYDLVVTPRKTSAPAAAEHGARRVMFAFFAADELSCLSASKVAGDWSLKRTEVVFVGTWMPERGAFLTELLDQGVPLQIFGQRWKRAPEYRRLRTAVVPGAVWGRQYADVIARSKIAIALLSEGNEDLHTTRSTESRRLELCCARNARRIIANCTRTARKQFIGMTPATAPRNVSSC